MRSVLNWLQTGSLAAAVWVGAMASDAMAAVIVNITQSGSNVVATLSGSLSSLGTPTGSSSNQGAGGSVLVVPGEVAAKYPSRPRWRSSDWVLLDLPTAIDASKKPSCRAKAYRRP